MSVVGTWNNSHPKVKTWLQLMTSCFKTHWHKDCGDLWSHVSSVVRVAHLWGDSCSDFVSLKCCISWWWLSLCFWWNRAGGTLWIPHDANFFKLLLSRYSYPGLYYYLDPWFLFALGCISVNILISWNRFEKFEVDKQWVSH